MRRWAVQLWKTECECRRQNEQLGVLIDKLLTVNDCADSQQCSERQREREGDTGRRNRKSRLTCL